MGCLPNAYGVVNGNDGAAPQTAVTITALDGLQVPACRLLKQQAAVKVIVACT